MSLPLAGVGSRVLAYGIDLALIFGTWLILYFGLTLLVSADDTLARVRSLGWLVQLGLVLGVFATQWAYWTVSDLVLGGQTLGKRALKLRVVREDGAPIAFTESALRNVARVVDFLPAAYAVGLLAMLISPRHRRLGDLLAGTVVVREEAIDLDKYAAPVDALPVAEGTPLRTETVELVTTYLERSPWLDPEARARIGARLLAHVAPAMAAAERAELLASPERLAAFLRSQVH